jgi:threonylcarbamoyladenosine tRNA methylthiotransferase CDKAL1
MRKYYIETYGCALAHYESLIMKEELNANGFSQAEGENDADVIIVNTCAVRLDTEQRIAERLEEIVSKYPNKKLIVAGCLAKARPGLIKSIAPRASLLSPQRVHRVVEAAREHIVDLSDNRPLVSPKRPPVSGKIATIMIQEGCRNKCSYCITKVARGAPRSFPPRIIVEQVKRSVELGAVEIRLTGTDTGAYGIDLKPRISLPHLLRMILDKVEGEYFIRVGMMTPEEALRIIDDLLDVYRDKRIFKFFHIPVQSGSDRVLKLMGRRYSSSDFIGLHKTVKNRFPESLFATDIIVGHPGESESDFQDTVSLVKSLRFERVHLAQYSIRPHTKAAAMRQISDGVKKRRSIFLNKLIIEIGSEIYGAYVGKIVEAIPVSVSFRGNMITARLSNYFPVILSGTNGLQAKKVLAKVVDASYFDLRGIVLERKH